MRQGLISELLRRRVPHVLSVYVAAGWGVVEAVDWLVSRYGLPASVVDATLVSLVVLIPSVILLAWFHGARGPDEWGWPEKIGIPLNLALVAAVFVFFVGDDIDRSSPSVAVLPFTDLSENAEHHYFAVGLSEELRHALSGIGGLYVPGSTSSNYYVDKNVELAVIGARLNVAHVLEGTIRRRGDSLRIAAKLINVANGFAIWSEEYDRRMTDILAIQADIARQVAGELRGELLSDAEFERLSDPGTDSTDAFEHYAIAQAHLRDRTLESECQAYRDYLAATEIDSGFADAWAGIATSIALMINNFGSRVCVAAGDARQIAQDAAARAMELDPESSFSWVARGVVAEGLEPSYRRTATATPETTLRAVEAFARAVELDPNNVLALAFLANVYEVALGDKETAVIYFQRALAIDPLERRPRINLGDSLMRLGRTDEALAEYMQLVADQPEWPVGWRYVHQHQMSIGKPDTALLVAMQSADRFPGEDGVKFDVVRAATGMDDFDTAFAFLDEQRDWEWAGEVDWWLRAVQSTDWPSLAQALSNAETPGEMGQWAFSLLQVGRPDFVEQMLQQVTPELFSLAEDIDPDLAGPALFLAYVRAKQGNQEELAALLGFVRSVTEQQDVPRPRHRQRLMTAALASLEGDMDKAIDELTAAVDAGFREIRPKLEVLPAFPVRLDENVFFENLHDDQRFIELIARIDEANAAARARLRSGESVSPLSHITSPTP